MTSKRISDQINTIRAATEKASVSSETALAFLRSAGIIPETKQAAGAGHKRGATAKLTNGAHQHAVTTTVTPKTTAIGSSRSRAAHYTVAKKSK
jgi:hypothetical protein